MPPLAEALAENCAPNLRFLHVIGGDPSLFSHLGTVHQADAFAYLHELVLEDFMLTEDRSHTWMEAVLASTHKGAALKLLKFQEGEGGNRQDELNCTLAVLGGVRRGAYPNVERFDTRKVKGWFCHVNNSSIAISLTLSAKASHGLARSSSS